ncbi:IKI3 family protein [Colletotrichum godetiae]|uniref:Elongator complex protein 1 n=1 Tax=Colletotrichum godetiae TaxID=1209918 RepID=A0AAJ0ESY0_9PEZI|nr:IKI3 family protein [Colletotrichum godetiae]KAK1674407.1 IKI3 family protein [Colletotrichum godetiae]
MRNLRNIRFSAWEQQQQEVDPSAVTACCWDPAKDELLCTTGPTEAKATIELVRLSEHHQQQQIKSHSVTSWDAPSPSPDLPADRVVSLHHFSDTLTTCVILEGGDIVTIQEDDDGAEVQIEIVGSIDAGIAAARWSPDEELLVVVTKEGNAVFMGRTFDPIADVVMTADDLKLSKHVSVGWGKKETQFQGKGAKAMRDPTIPEKVDEGLPSVNEDGTAAVSWRGDGAYVAVNSVAGDARRVVRVYSREGVLDSVSEPVDHLEGGLSWRPSGNLIAGIQRFEDRTDVVFFERNGLRHGQFTLRSADGPLSAHEKIRLEWNSDSTVLAVILSDRIQLWTTGNYHWYLKQEIPLASAFAGLAWHPEKPLRFVAATTSIVNVAEYIFTVSRGSLSPPHDHGAVAVIDGQTLKLTPFRTAQVPPPMALFELDFPSSVLDVVFDPSNELMAVLHRGGLDVYEWQTKGERSVKPTPRAKIAFEADAQTRVPLQVAFSDAAECRVLVSDGGLKLESYTIEASSISASGVTQLRPTETISSLFSREGDSGVEACAQDRSGKLYSVAGTRGPELLLETQLSMQLPWCELHNINRRSVGIGMTRNGHLYANSKQLAKNCTSFVVTPAHIIFTTNNHFVKFVHLVDPEEMEVPGDDPEIDERCRSIERGARLVTATPTNMNLVLQMPRGNLETIFPRAMVVAGIRQLVDEKNYGRAFAFCRTQRVDMNILYDHQPSQFLSNVGLFLDQLKDISYIDLFLSSLRDEDVTQTMYKDTKRSTRSFEPSAETPAPLDASPKSKVNKICDAILKSLQTKKSTNLQNIITAHVCKVPPALEDGLTLVAELMQEDEKLAEKAVEHICFLVDVYRLYDNALGLYSLDLALLVAQQSQRDPREYLPFIQNLHNLPDLRRKFEIDDHLDRRAKALLHLKALDAFDELCGYTTKHALYQDALSLYRYDQARHQALTGLYASYLESNSKYRDAGLAYETLQNFAKATSCYRAAGVTCWRESLFAAQQQSPPPSDDALTELASSLADALWEGKEYAAAATIHADYLASLETAVKCLCKGYHFAEALRLIARDRRADLLPTVFDTGLVEALSSSTEFLADCKAQLLAQVPRIVELRRKAAEDPLAFYEGERPGGTGIDIPDDVSVATSRVSTSASLFTRYTGKEGSIGTAGTGVSRATSKNRKREEKKRARGRKGTVYEEEYLVNSVRRLVERVEGGAKDEVGRLVFALVRRGMTERARAVEVLVAEVVEGCKAAVREVFAVKETEQEGAVVVGLDGETYLASGGDAVFQEHLEARTKKLEPPALSIFQKLTLLGS